MSDIRESFVRRRCLIGVMSVYGIIILVVIVAFNNHMTSKKCCGMTWPAFIQSGIAGLSHGKDENATWRTFSAEMLIIAIGGGITSKGLNDLTANSLSDRMSLFTIFIPSFCDTASPGFNYHFYFAYDSSDPLFNDPTFLATFESTFGKSIRQTCPSNMNVSIRTVRCQHNHKPTWAQNDAMMEAYLNDADYFYRINDDTKMITNNWVEQFVEVLRTYVPANVGVVGPKHYGGNTLILTYDFVHRTHIEIFGFYYPRLFRDWWGDNWITDVYQPFRSTKHQSVLLEHTMGMMRRYNISTEVEMKLESRVEKDKGTLKRYIDYTKMKNSIKVDGRKVISMSLYGRDPKYTWGAIRNAQIAPIFFPGWKLRFYVTSRNSKAADVKSCLVPKRILNKLRQLGAEIAYVKTMSIPPVFWRYLVVDDNSVDYFIIRNAHSRLSERDAIVVNDWIDHQDPKSEANSLHCIRDHPTHTNRSIVDGLWGAKTVSMQRLINGTIETVLSEFLLSTASSNKSNLVSIFLDNVLWPVVASKAFCHIRVTCDRNTYFEYIGQEFDEHEEPTSESLASHYCQTNISLNTDLL